MGELNFFGYQLEAEVLVKEKLMCAAEFFRQRPNFLVDLAEIIFQKLATLTVYDIDV
jgi:hypothetical protein